jgi:hypothetical protein
MNLGKKQLWKVRNQPIRNKYCLWRPCLLMDRYKMSNCNRGLSIDAFYHRFSIMSANFVPIHVQTWPPQAILVSDWLISKNLFLWNHSCFLPSFGSFGQAVSEEKNLKNQPIRNKNRLWRPCLLTETLSHNVVSSTPRVSGIRTRNVSGDRHWLHRYRSYKSNYHTIIHMNNFIKPLTTI